jgi:hypothetical protein
MSSMLALLIVDMKLNSSKIKEVAGGIMLILNIMKICHSVQKLLVRGTHKDIIIVISNFMGKVGQEDLSSQAHRNVKQSLFFDL